MQKIRLLILVLILSSFTTFETQAQLLNIESVRANADSAGWYGALEVDLSLNRYNETVMELTNESNISYFSQKHAYLLLNKLKIVNLDGNSVVSSGYSHLRSTFIRKNRISPELFFQYQYNSNQGLESRALAGVGFIYRLFETEKWTGSFSSGLMTEYERWQLNQQPAIENRLIKSTSNILLRGNLNEQTSFLLVGYYQARPDKFLNSRSILETKLKVKINQSIALSLGFTTAYDVDPVIDIPKWTYELTNGIVINF